MSTTIKRKLTKLRERVKREGISQEITSAAMALYRKRSEYITKEDLLLFGIIIKKS